jgi:hypothetical protein
MKLMWSSLEESKGETEYCPWVGNRTMEAAQQHIIARATVALEAVHACQRIRDESSNMGLTLIGPRRWRMREMATDSHMV